VFFVISVYFDIRNTLPKSGSFLLGYSVYTHIIADNNRIHTVFLSEVNFFLQKSYTFTVFHIYTEKNLLVFSHDRLIYLPNQFPLWPQLTQVENYYS
jgi:hypothetical protein